jgi:hypothetical protein
MYRCGVYYEYSQFCELWQCIWDYQVSSRLQNHGVFCNAYMVCIVAAYIANALNFESYGSDM